MNIINRIRQWRHEMGQFWVHLLRRDRPEAGPVLLDRRRVYILPTRAGFIFALILFAMLIGAINYNNSLAYALTFLLTGLGMVSMVHTFRNLHQLRFNAGRATPVFAGNRVTFPLSIDNHDRRARWAIDLNLPDESVISIDINGADQSWAELHMATARRGRLVMPRVTVASQYPVGLFRAWAYVHLDVSCVVYPKPAEQHGLPKEFMQSEGAIGDRGQGSDDFASLRNYHPGDSLRHIHWKAFAREQGLLTKQFGGDQSAEIWLSWEQLGGVDVENRLAFLCRWVLEADGLGLRYGLVLPNRRLAPANNESHRRQCLEALALFGNAR